MVVNDQGTSSWHERKDASVLSTQLKPVGHWVSPHAHVMVLPQAAGRVTQRIVGYTMHLPGFAGWGSVPDGQAPASVRIMAPPETCDWTQRSPVGHGVGMQLFTPLSTEASAPNPVVVPVVLPVVLVAVVLPVVPVAVVVPVVVPVVPVAVVVPVVVPVVPVAVVVPVVPVVPVAVVVPVVPVVPVVLVPPVVFVPVVVPVVARLMPSAASPPSTPTPPSPGVDPSSPPLHATKAIPCAQTMPSHRRVDFIPLLIRPLTLEL